MPVVYMEKSALDGLDEASIKKLIDENCYGPKYERLQGYYEGKHKILGETKRDSTAPNNRIVNNMAKYITDTAVGYFIGKPVTYNSQNDAYQATLQDIFDYNDEQDENSELGKVCSIKGECFEMLYIDEDATIRFTKLPPDFGVMICATGDNAPMAMIRQINSRDRDGNPIRKVEFWDAQQCWYFRSFNGSELELQDIVEHYWHDVPFVLYVNNEERLGDFEGIISVIDAYNRAQSNTANFFQYNDEALLKIFKLGQVTSQDIAEMKEKGTIILEDGGDIDWLIKEINDTALENYKKRLRDDMHIFSSVPNLTDTNFGGNLSGVAVSYKLWSLEQVCAIKERKFKRGLQRRIELITNMLNLQGAHYDYRDIDIQFRRNKPQNLLEIAQIITTLAPELSRETRLQMWPNLDNVQDELKKLADEKEQDTQSFGSNGYDALAKALQGTGANASGDLEPPTENGQPTADIGAVDSSSSAPKIAQISLNGAQIQSLLQIVQAVVKRELEYDSAVVLITSAFPFNERTAKEILGNPRILQEAAT